MQGRVGHYIPVGGEICDSLHGRFAASDIDFPALATLEGLVQQGGGDLLPIRKSCSVIVKCLGHGSEHQSGALSKLSSDACSYRARARSSSESMVVTMPAPFLYASAASLLTRGSASTGAVMIGLVPVGDSNRLLSKLQRDGPASLVRRVIRRPRVRS